jgi:crotonobetainyl-CoA:carnitine CoA-transferase CaiB-like acyl-CoA transferase
MVAGGLAGMLLADFGADVVKVEQPGTGDPLRHWTTEGAPLWWQVYARNKRFITLNIPTPEGRALLLKLLPRFDVLLESFIPHDGEVAGGVLASGRMSCDTKDLKNMEPTKGPGGRGCASQRTL